MAELVIPHFATKCIFLAAKDGATAASFTGYLKLLAVRGAEGRGAGEGEVCG